MSETYKKNYTQRNYKHNSALPTEGLVTFPGNEGVFYSLGKAKRWEMIEDEDVDVLKYYNRQHERGASYKVYGATPRKGFPGGTFGTYQVSRKYSKVLKKTADPEAQVYLPFQKDEYPLGRESKREVDTPCMGCLRSYGAMWMLKGQGEKAKKKTKGFKKVHYRELNFE